MAKSQPSGYRGSGDRSLRSAGLLCFINDKCEHVVSEHTYMMRLLLSATFGNHCSHFDKVVVTYTQQED